VRCGNISGRETNALNSKPLKEGILVTPETNMSSNSPVQWGGKNAKWIDELKVYSDRVTTSQHALSTVREHNSVIQKECQFFIETTTGYIPVTACVHSC
jgi:hypothetical protein